MAEKDPKKVDEKAGTQTSTVQLSPDAILILNALTSNYPSIQQNMARVQQLATEPTQQGESPDKAKEAAERFNFIRAGLQLRPIPYPQLFKPVSEGLKVVLTWNIVDKKDPPRGFRILRADGKDSEEFKEITDMLPPSPTSYTDTNNLVAGVIYRYKVVAFTSMGPLTSKPQDVEIKSN